MSGQIDHSANGIFDYLVTEGNELAREATRAILSTDDKVTAEHIIKWKDAVLPSIMEVAQDGAVKTFLHDRVHTEDFGNKRVIGCALRRFKREEAGFTC